VLGGTSFTPFHLLLTAPYAFDCLCLLQPVKQRLVAFGILNDKRSFAIHRQYDWSSGLSHLFDKVISIALEVGQGVDISAQVQHGWSLFSHLIRI